MKHAEPEHVRKALAESYAKRASSKRYTTAERAAFARMAEAWAKTLPSAKLTPPKQ